MFDLIPQKDKERLKTATSNTEITDHQGVHVQTPEKGVGGGSSSSSNRSTDHSVQSLSSSVTEGRGLVQQSSSTMSVAQPTKPLNLQAFQTGKGAVFSPFIKDPEKQRRYDRYISLVKEGKSGLS